MIIDFHTHIFPKQIRNNRENYFKDEPAFKLLYDSSKAKLSGVKELINTMNEYGVDISVVFGFPWKSGYLAKKNNDYILECVAKYPSRLKGFACFDLSWQGAYNEAQRCINSGLSGIGELAFYLSKIDKNALLLFEPIMEICKKSGNLPVMIHTNEPVGHNYSGKTKITLKQIYNLASYFPDNKIILAHFGGGIFFYNLLKKETKKVLKNIWYDTAASPFLYDSAIYKIAFEIGIIEKILFATDYPLLKPARYYQDLDNSKISEINKKKILGENAVKLLKL